MDARIAALAGGQSGAFSAAEAQARGIDSTLLRTALRDGDLVRVRRGAYVARRQWDQADRECRYRLTVMAVARTRPGDAVSHHASLAMHGLPLWKHDEKRIDLLGDVEQAVGRAGVWVHPRGSVVPEEVDGIPVVSIARAIVRTAVTMGVECAVVAGDRALHAGLVTRAQLLDEVALLTPHQGRARALDTVLRMNGAAESVGESRTRLALQDLGLAHRCQVLIRDSSGAVVARVDFLVEGVVLEFDGRVKYRGSGPESAETVWQEKRREDSIRRLGYPVERAVWDDLDRPGILGARIRAARPRST
jgi:hypothetical protein